MSAFLRQSHFRATIYENLDVFWDIHFEAIPFERIPLKAPKGGHRRLPHFGKAFEEGKSRKGSNPRQETVPHLSRCVAERGKHNQRRAGGLEAPQSSLEASKSRVEAPKSRPGGSKIEAWRLQNRAKSHPKRHFLKTST